MTDDSLSHQTESGSAPVSGWRIERYAAIGSTMDLARERALAGDPGRLWILAEEQTEGRGRRGRAWASPRGNLYASALLVSPSPIAKGAQIGFVAGVALHRAVADLGASREVVLKWPNDLLWRGAKLAGLLADGLLLRDGRFACIVGIGVNCGSAPDGMPYATSDLSHALGRSVSPAELFERLAPRFVEALALWRGGEGFAQIRAAWLSVAAGLGGPIRVTDSGGSREGIFEALDAQGRLLLRRAGTLEIIEAGDLSLVDSGAADAPATRKAANL